MDLIHVHLLLNHFPTVGFVIGLMLFVTSLAAKNNELRRVSLVLFVAIALVTIPAYVSGNAAEEVLCPGGAKVTVCADPSVSNSLIQTHEGAALLAFAAIILTGAFSWLGLWQMRRTSRAENWNLAVILLLSLVAFGLAARAANIGGEIRHPEMRAAEETVTPEGHLARKVGSFVLALPYGWPSLETLHFIGLSLLIGVILLIDLRMLGVMKNVAFPALHRLLPWAILGFGTNLVTGILFFVASPDQYDQNMAFAWKMILVMLAGANALYFTLFDEAWVLKPGDDAPLTAKAVAVSAIALWLGVLYFGSMLPFLGNSF